MHRQQVWVMGSRERLQKWSKKWKDLVNFGVRYNCFVSKVKHGEGVCEHVVQIISGVVCKCMLQVCGSR